MMVEIMTTTIIKTNETIKEANAQLHQASGYQTDEKNK